MTAVAADPGAPRAFASVPRYLLTLIRANLVAQVGIVVTGGAVRLTGSGLGCPTWPQCMPGSFTPVVHEANRFHAYVEFGNRLLTFVLGLLAIALLVAAIRHARRRRRDGLPRRRRLTVLAAVPLLGTLVQAVIGGITVLTALHPLTVALHFLVSIAIIGMVVVLLDHAHRGDDPLPMLSVPTSVWWGTRILVGVSFIVIVIGTIVTGSGPHAGDADMPVRLGLDPRTVSWLHADSVLLFIGLTVGLLVASRLSSEGARLTRALTILLVVSLSQGLVGYVQYFTGLPIVLVGLHMLGACLVWIATLRAHLATRQRVTS